MQKLGFIKVTRQLTIRIMAGSRLDPSPNDSMARTQRSFGSIPSIKQASADRGVNASTSPPLLDAPLVDDDLIVLAPPFLEEEEEEEEETF